MQFYPIARPFCEDPSNSMANLADRWPQREIPGVSAIWPAICHFFASSCLPGIAGAIVVPKPPAKHLTQPHQEANRSLQNPRFCGKFSVLVRLGEVPNV